MDDNFKGRVDKVFGSLASSRSPSSLSSLWSITDNEVERKQWRRSTDNNGRDEMPCSSSFDECLKRDRGASRRRKFQGDVDDLDDEEGLGGPHGRGGRGDENEWDIRSSIGLDRTLDYEEEEDAYDKVALGRENAGDRLYMSDVSEHGSYLNSQNVLQNSLHSFKKDPRANIMAAKVRLKEDDAEAQKFNSAIPDSAECKEPRANVDARPKSILRKRKDSEDVSKRQKRVKFDPVYVNNYEETSIRNAVVSDPGGLVTDQNASKVPDYLVNPSKYTRYHLDSTSEVDGDSNTQACFDILGHFQNSNNAAGSEQENTSANNPKRVQFIPKKKATDVEELNDSSVVKQNNEGDSEPYQSQAGFRVGIAAGEVQGEVNMLEEEVPETISADISVGLHKPVRRYRTLARSDEDESDF